jgi:hypothetical protein
MSRCGRSTKNRSFQEALSRSAASIQRNEFGARRRISMTLDAGEKIAIRASVLR